MDYWVTADFSDITNYIVALHSVCIILPLSGITGSSYLSRLLQFIGLWIKLCVRQLITLLFRIITACDYFPFQIMFKALFLLFLFFTLSNILTHSVSACDNFRHPCREKNMFSYTGACIIVKWSKTLQNRRNIATPYLHTNLSAGQAWNLSDFNP